jgi:Leucine Rich repeat
VDASSAEACARVATAATRMHDLQAIELSLPARDVATLLLHCAALPRNAAAAYERLAADLPSRARVAALHIQEVSALESVANGAEALRSALLVAPGGLTRLRLRAPHAGAPPLLAMPALQSAFQALSPSLRVLDMSGCRVGVHGTAALQYVSALTSLTALDLAYNALELTPGGAERSVSSIVAILGRLQSLEHLSLRSNPIGMVLFHLVTPCLADLPRLRSLDLRDTCAGGTTSSKVTSAFINMLQNGELRGICFSPLLTRLDLSYNGLQGALCGPKVPCIAGLHRLQTLVMRGVELGARGAAVVGQHLSGLTELKRLELDWNYIGSRGAEAIAAGLVALPQMAYLDLIMSSIHWGRACWRHVCSA